MIGEVAQVARNWWMFVLPALIGLVTGILAVVWPDITLLTLGILAGVYLMIAAIMEIIDAIVGDPGGRALSAILGIVSLIAGLIFIRRPGESLLAIVMVAGIFLIAEGVIRIVRAFSSVGNRWWSVAVGAIDVIAGIIRLARHRARNARGVLRGDDGGARRGRDRGRSKLRGLRHELEQPAAQTATYAT